MAPAGRPRGPGLGERAAAAALAAGPRAGSALRSFPATARSGGFRCPGRSPAAAAVPAGGRAAPAPPRTAAREPREPRGPRGRPVSGVPALPARERRSPAGRTHVALRVDGLQQPVPDLLRGGGRSRCHCLGEAGRLRPGRAGGGCQAGPGRRLLTRRRRPPRGAGVACSLPARRGKRRWERSAGGTATGPGPTVPLGAKLNCGQEPAPRRAPWDTPDAVTHGAPLTPRRTHRRARSAPAHCGPARSAHARSAPGGARRPR